MMASANYKELVLADDLSAKDLGRIIKIFLRGPAFVSAEVIFSEAESVIRLWESSPYDINTQTKLP